MDPAVARRLVAEEGAQALAAAAIQADPGSLAAATALRKLVDPSLAAAALAQEALRRRARTKFGEAASGLWFTPDGLEQATRPSVARWRANRFAGAGVRRVVDLGCGLGIDALALAEVGLEVLAIERDETTAILAAANMRDLNSSGRGSTDGAGPRRGGSVTVRQGDATTVTLADDQAAFCDPARRTATGRSWNVADFSPPWDFVTGLLDRPAGACIKLGPGLPQRLIPESLLAEWVSDRGDVVEASLWSTALAEPGRAATLLPAGDRLTAVPAAVPVGPIKEFVHEPDGAVLAAGALGSLAEVTGAHRVHREVAYLTTDRQIDSPFWTSFEVLDALPWREKEVRRWVRDHGIGTLEIKKRGIEVDPAALRRRLRLRGSTSATILITPTPAAARVLVVRRC
jgi:SAM-dependent methyltransferase